MLTTNLSWILKNVLLGAPGGLSRVSDRLLISAQVTISRLGIRSLELGSALPGRGLLGIRALLPPLCSLSR